MLSRITACVVLVAWLPVMPVAALHLVDHRYDITGYVIDAGGKALPGIVVVAQMDDEKIGSGRTDTRGHYLFRVHLHDSDAGRALQVKTPDSAGSIRVSVTPGDTSTQRIHHVNFVAGELVEGELSGRGGLSNATLIAGVLVVVALGSFFTARHFRRLRRRQVRAAQKAQNRSGSKRRKRRGL